MPNYRLIKGQVNLNLKATFEGSTEAVCLCVCVGIVLFSSYSAGRTRLLWVLWFCCSTLHGITSPSYRATEHPAANKRLCGRTVHSITHSSTWIKHHGNIHIQDPETLSCQRNTHANDCGARTKYQTRAHHQPRPVCVCTLTAPQHTVSHTPTRSTNRLQQILT